MTVTGGTLVQNGNNRYTVIVNGDCTVTVSFGQIGNGNLSQEHLKEIADTVRTVLLGDSTETEKQVKVSMISGQGVAGDPLVAENEHTHWANALSTALHAGTDENTIASVNDTNYAMIVLHGAYIGISGSETNSTQRLL